jgi:hypothetical protein
MPLAGSNPVPSLSTSAGAGLTAGGADPGGRSEFHEVWGHLAPSAGRSKWSLMGWTPTRIVTAIAVGLQIPNVPRTPACQAEHGHGITTSVIVTGLCSV